MGKWTLEALRLNHSLLDDEQYFGHNFKVKYTMKYTTTLGTGVGFTEPPMLDWHEKVVSKEIDTRGYCRYEAKMYELKPTSLTTGIWMQRYLDAYRGCAGIPNPGKGSSRLRSKEGQPVTLATLGAGSKTLTEPKKQAEAVRDYLKSKGGILDIEVHDIPSLTWNVERNTERCLTLDCGLVGITTMRVKAEQHLIVNTAQPRSTWTRSLKVGQGQHHVINISNFTRVDPPVRNVTRVAPYLKEGEYL